MAKYQVFNNSITAVNPSTLTVSELQYGYSIGIDVPITQTNRHKKIIGYTLSFNTDGGLNNNKLLEAKGYLDAANSQLLVGQSILNGVYKFIKYPYPGYSTSFSEQVPVESVFNRLILSINNMPTGTSLNITNFTCSHVWGSVAIPIIVTNILKSFVNYKNEFLITFSTKNDGTIFEQFAIISGVFKYREKGTNEAYLEIEFDGTGVSIPKDTLINGKIYECYATCKADDGQSADSPSIELTTIDTIPVSKAKSPVNEIAHGEVNFSWIYENATSTEQYAFDLQISKDGIDFTDLDTHVITNTTNTNHVVEAGDLYWRVRGYNQNDIQGEWSQIAKFINVAKPTKPIINEIQSSGRPLIKWSADNQIAFELEIVGLFKTGQVYSVDKYYKFSEYIPNGIYNVRIRVYNKYDQFSDWAEFEYNQNMIVELPIVKVEETKLGYNINIIKNPNHEKYYLLRNGVPIHKFISENFNDIHVNGNTKYTVRAIDFYDNFSDVDVYVNRKIEDEIVVIDKSGEVFDLSLGIDDLCQVTLNTKKEYSKVMYLGKNKPSLYHGDDIAREWTINSNFNDLPIGELLFYRDYSGVSAWVMAYEYSAELQSWISRGNTVLIEVDYEEGIDYD